MDVNSSYLYSENPRPKNVNHNNFLGSCLSRIADELANALNADDPRFANFQHH